MLISVIIPVYNVEKYLEQCLDSVISQSYKNLEIICVDDYSTDNSLKILENYAEKDERIKIIKNNKNIGIGLTRNVGLKAATGDFIHYIDSDDWLELNAYEVLSQYFGNEVDAIKFAARYINQITNEIVVHGTDVKDYYYKKINIFNDSESIKNFDHTAWIRIYRRKFLLENDIYFNNYRCYEDVQHGLKCLLLMKNEIYIENVLYNYRLNRKNSTVSKKLYYTNKLVNDTIWTDKQTENLPDNLRALVLNHIYYQLIVNSLDAYYYNILSFQDLQKHFSVINLEYLNKDYFFKLIKKVLVYGGFKFFLSYKVRRFIKTNFPTFTKYYMKLKKNIKIT